MTGVQYKQPYKQLTEGKRSKFCLSRKPWYVKMALGIITTLVVGFVCVFAVFATTFPLHASCKIKWNFGISCSAVKSKLVDQIEKWNGPAGCAGGGEKCLYKKVSDSENVLSATHETPKKHYVDDLTFTFTGSGDSCSVQGFSTSETWYALLDQGTNYCNLENLITGSGLNKEPSYKEDTSDSVCTQFSKADCNKY